MRRLSLALTVVALLVVAGCGDNNETPADEANQGQTQEVSTSAPEPSTSVAAPPSGTTTEGVPLPPGATETANETWSVPDMTHDEVVAWYGQRMPVGEDFKGWDWCDTGGGERNPTLIYSKSGRRILIVAMLDGDPPSLLIGTDRSGPCRCGDRFL